ncbi:MAG: T9SS type A sorting domain-containing protein [Bacteroidales bacterium]
MKKFTFLVALMASMAAVSAQNLLVNPSFESWTAGKPDGWNITTAANGAMSQSTTTIVDGANSAKVVGGTGTYDVNQAVPVTAGKTYTVQMSYFIEAGDGTDARIWCNFKNAAGKYWSMALADSLALKGPNATATAGYFPDVRGSWQTYTYDVVAPVGYELFSYAFRTYKTPAIVYWDNMAFGEKGTLALHETKFDGSIFLSGKTLKLANVISGTTVEVFNAIGKRVEKGLTNGSSYDLSKLAKGMYIVRVGSISKKITL